MLTLGIHDGHTATACLFEDGEILACISEERINRIKGCTGFPELAIQKCFEISGKKYEEVDAIGVCSLMPQIGTERYFQPPAYKKIFSSVSRIVPESILQSPENIKILQKTGDCLFSSRRRDITNKLKDLGFSTDKVFFFEHHELHAATAFYTNWYKPDKTLVITLDGSGD